DLGHALDDADVALDGAFELLVGGLIGRAVIGGGGLLDAVELDQNDALHHAEFKGLGWHAARNEAATGCLQGRACVSRVSRERVGVRDGAVGCDPVGFCHRSLLLALETIMTEARMVARRVAAASGTRAAALVIEAWSVRLPGDETFASPAALSADEGE